MLGFLFGFFYAKQNKIGHLLLATTTWKEAVAMWGSVSSPRKQVSGWEEMAQMVSSCTKEYLDWELGKVCLLKGLSSIRTGCSGKLSHHPWGCLKVRSVWHLGAWFSVGLAGARSMSVHDDLRGFFQPKWFYEFLFILATYTHFEVSI